MSLYQLNTDSVDLYDRLAPRYDRNHERWLRHAGGEAQAALEAAVRALATPESTLLDVGCGTGAFARRLISEGISPSRITLLDPSEAMLAHCEDIPVHKVNAHLEKMPFEDGSFDFVSCAWVLETIPDMNRGLKELCRVVRPGGRLCLAFCADRPGRGALNWLMRHMIVLRGTGRFLRPDIVVEQLNASRRFDAISLPCTGSAFVLLARHR